VIRRAVQAGGHVRFAGEDFRRGEVVLFESSDRVTSIAFLRFLLTPGKGGALQQAAGPEPIQPALVSPGDYSKVPAELRPLLSVSTLP